MTKQGGLPESESGRWQTIVEEAETLAAEQSSAGAETLVIHPGDVTPRFSEVFGFDVLAPGSEFDAAKTLADEHSFTRSHVYRHDGEARTFLLCIFEATPTEGQTDSDTAAVPTAALFVPLYLTTRALDRLHHETRERDEVPVHVRPLTDDERATFTCADPDLFFT